ncbi:MAG: hypothetical protein IPH96_13225 [Saprospiraceae bacterium]|nr:hypothetical protein [Saprospiraceae bacterium]
MYKQYRSSDPCSNTYTSAQICTYVIANPTSPLALADCDNGGISNIIECQNGGDPLNPSDDCNVINSGVVDICETLAVNPTSPLANWIVTVMDRPTQQSVQTIQIH